MVRTKIELKNVNFIYQPDTPLAHAALKDINLKITEGSFTALVGQTGSGKSTLVNLIDALTLPSSGEIIINGKHLTNKTSKKERGLYRRQVGFVFQFPERQLFAQTVREDIGFGPHNLGWSQAEIDKAVIEALNTVQLDTEVLNRSPFELSGGQKRRVAIAGVLAMKPEVLILDEPTVGLDSHGIKQLLKIITDLNQQGVTIIMITHCLELVSSLANQIIALQDGKLVFDGRPADFFSDPLLLAQSNLLAPPSVQISQDLGLEKLALSLDILADELISRLNKKEEENE